MASTAVATTYDLSFRLCFVSAIFLKTKKKFVDYSKCVYSTNENLVLVYNCWEFITVF